MPRDRANKTECFVCGKPYPSSVMSRLNTPEKERIHGVAKRLRMELRRPEKNVDDGDRLCVHCSQKVWAQHNKVSRPFEITLRCLGAPEVYSCVFCNRRTDVHEIPEPVKIHIFIETGIFIPKQRQSCYEHFNEDRTKLLPPLLNGIVGMSRQVEFTSDEMVNWLHVLRSEVHSYGRKRFEDENSFSEEDFVCMTSLTTEAFRNLWTNLNTNEPVEGRYMKKSDLILFLTKLRQGLTDEFLRTMFQYSSRRAVSHAIETTRKILMRDFVPRNLGLAAITREQYIEEHVTSFANELYNRDGNGEPRADKVAIAVVDGTYVYVPKVSNFKVLRQSYCVHKGRHLLKPVMVTAPDGYILDVHGPYFSDSQNNDAALLLNELKKQDATGLRTWLQPNDVLLVDRGYRDSLSFLEALGINHKMPNYLPKEFRQHSYHESNSSRLVTKSRWIVEARNAHVKLKYKFLKDLIPVHHLPHVGDFFRIACALLNKYFPVVNMNLPEEYAAEMLERARMPNELQIKVEVDNMLRIRRDWISMTTANLPIFPKLSIDYLKDLTMGVYQLKLARSYVQDKIRREGDYEFQVSVHEDGLLHARIYSRFSNSTKYQIFITYKEPTGRDTQEELEEIHTDPILGWYCQCKSGARTLGCCAHIASVLWYLGYARHEPTVRYPSDRLLNLVGDAGHRTLPTIVD